MRWTLRCRQDPLGHSRRHLLEAWLCRQRVPHTERREALQCTLCQRRAFHPDLALRAAGAANQHQGAGAGARTPLVHGQRAEWLCEGVCLGVDGEEVAY